MGYYSACLTLLLYFLATGLSYGQTVNFEDGFEDGNFTENPAWSGDDSLFVISAIEENNLLQLTGNEGDNPAYLSTPSTKITGSWEFFFKYNASSAPSGRNKATVFLMSDRSNLKGAVDGYAVQVGESGDDVFRIVRYDEGEGEAILSDTTVIKNNETGYRVKVTRSSIGEWQIEAGKGYSGKLYSDGATTIDNTYTSSSYFGVLVDYTSTRADKFFFDFKIGLPPFSVTEVIPSAKKSIDVVFNRAYGPATVSPNDFSLNKGFTKPSTLEFPAADTIRIHYPEPLPSAKYELSVSGISDLSGKLIQPAQKTFTVFGNYSADDVQINEFMYDPPSGLPEYLEVINTSKKYLNLSGWKIGDDSNIYSINAEQVLLAPYGYIAISSDTTALFNAFGDRPYFQNSLPAFNNSGDSIRLLTSPGSVADSLSYDSPWGGENVALERRSLSTSASYKENWGNSPHPKGGTPGFANQTAPDKKPPRLTGLEIASGQALKLTFNERVDENSVANPLNYSISNSDIHSVNFTNPSSVNISLTTSLQNAQRYAVSISGVKDIFGNAADIDTSFTFYKISAADSGDVFINEFSFDPPPGLTEYVELYNPTSKSFNLQNWTLSDNRGNRSTIIGSQFIIPPKSFAVIAPDNTFLNEFPEISLITMSGFPSLNNSGDDIILHNAEGALMDSFQYISSWGGGTSLERRTTKVSATFKENWGESTQTGSPGFANGIAADRSPPALTKLFAADASTLKLIFSERVAASSAAKIANYKISPARKIQLISAQKNEITLFLAEDLKSGETYDITASNISDVFGNSIASSSREIEYLKTDKARRGDIVINEFLHRPGTDNSAEFIEVYNASDKNFDLSNWYIGDTSNKISIGKNVQLRAKSYLVLTESKAFANTKNNAIALSGFPALNNSGDAIYLQNKTEITIDSLRYSSAWGGSVPGKSFERKDPLAASNDASNWQVNSNPAGNSACVKNSRFQPDEEPPQAIFSKILVNGKIEVRFNEFIQLTDDIQFSANNRRLSVASFDTASANAVVLEMNPAKIKSPAAKITVHNLTDIKGNQTSKTEIAIAQPLQPADLVVNEIMYNPLNDPDDNRADQSEYLELRNAQDYAISLEGIVLHDAPDEDGNLRELQPVSTEAKWVPPQGVVLIYAGQTAFFEQSKTANFFDLTLPKKRSLLHINRASLSLASSGDAIFIADSTGTTIDSVFYDESWQNPNLIDNTGIALERISPEGNSNNESNWGSSVHAKGGTPNSENSIYQANAKPSEEIGISFSPNPFSPDGDGYEDNLFINYRLDQADYLLKVQIYDRYGRFIKELADGEQAGFEGTLIWDGRKGDGSRNRIGIFIVVFEAYNSAAGKNRAFKKTVVLARRLN